MTIKDILLPISLIPESIGNLTNLEWLYIGANQLSFLPENIYNLINLRAFIVGENQLTSISENIGNLININTLGLNDNQLITLPESICNIDIQSITYYFSNNMICPPYPSCILEEMLGEQNCIPSIVTLFFGENFKMRLEKKKKIHLHKKFSHLI